MLYIIHTVVVMQYRVQMQPTKQEGILWYVGTTQIVISPIATVSRVVFVVEASCMSVLAGFD